MEGKNEEFDLFNECHLGKVEKLLDFFPSNNSLENFEKQNENLKFFIFPDSEIFTPFNDHINLMDRDQLLEKINICDENYNTYLQNNLICSPTTNGKDEMSENFESNLILAKGTLPGLIISIMHRENCLLTENQIINEISPKFGDLRKGDIKKVIKSTLSCSRIFFKTVDSKFYFKEKEALDYIIKLAEKILTKNLEKQTKPSKSNESKKSKKKKNVTFCSQMNYKICKVYNILDKMISRCRNTIEEKLNNSFENVNYSIELLQKIGGQNKFVKILMFFKYFKSIINKYFKISSKNKKLEYFNLNNLNEDLDFLSRKMDVLEKSIPNLSSKNSTLSFKSNNSNTDSLINPYNFYYPLSETNFAIHPQSSITNLDL